MPGRRPAPEGHPVAPPSLDPKPETGAPPAGAGSRSIARPWTRLGGGLGSPFWRLWSASALSNLSDGIFWIALPLLAVALTDSPALIAGVTVASRLPWLLFSLVAGALADRLDRRRTMVIVDVARSVTLGSLALAVVLDVASLPLIYAVAFVLGTLETLFDTSAQSIMPSLVERDQLSRANGRLYAVELTMNQFVGPPVGGFLAAVGIATAFGAGAIAYLVGAFALLTIAGSFRAVREGPARRLDQEIAEGLRYLLRHRVLRTLAMMVGGGNLAFSAAFAVFVLYAVAPGPLGLDEVGFGVLMTSLAVGSLVGSFLAERMERLFGRANLLVVSVVMMALGAGVPAFTSSPFVVAIAFFVSGVGVVAWNVVTVSLRQRIVPDHLLGRLNASYRLLAWGTQPLGAILGGVIGEALGVRAVFIVSGVLTLLCLVGRVVVTDEAIAAAEAESEAAPAPAG
ncbi:MAG TPA: MFS transporter [Candidatus Limnocylindrales bacterium]